MTAFRVAYVQTLPLRLVDVLMHLTVAFALPGPWWYQGLPDIMLPVLWTKAMITDTFEPDWSLLLAAHRTLHLRGRLGLLAGIGVVCCAWLWPVLAGQLLAHVAIDTVTHEGAWL